VFVLPLRACRAVVCDCQIGKRDVRSTSIREREPIKELVNALLDKASVAPMKLNAVLAGRVNVAIGAAKPSYLHSDDLLQVEMRCGADV